MLAPTASAPHRPSPLPALSLSDVSLGPVVMADDPCEAAFSGEDPTGPRKYYRARYYTPSLGRFLSEDPLGVLHGGVNLYAYVGNGPILNSDPSGLVKWTGDAYTAVVAGPVGAGYGRFELTSECACGKRVRVHVDAVGPAVGLGLKVTGSYSEMTFYDPGGCPNPDVFDGLFTMASAGATFGSRPFKSKPGFGFRFPGLGIGWAQIRLGGADSEPFTVGPTIGRDLSVTGVVGTATVTYANPETCCGR